MKTIKLLLSITFLLLVFAAVGYLSYQFWLLLKSIDNTIIAAFITAIAGISGLIFTQWQSKKREIAEGHRPNKVKVYELFLDIVDKFLNTEKNGSSVYDENGKLSDELENQFRKLTRGFIVWSSPKVLKAWLNFRTNAGLEHKNTMLLVDDVLQAIRSDLGNSNFSLVRGDVVKLYLRDPNEI